MGTAPAAVPVRLDAVAAGGTGAVPEVHASVGERLAELARLLPHHVALESADGRLTFAETAAHVRALAIEIRRTLATHSGDLGPSPVGVFAEQSTASVVAMLAVLAAGHPCVVLDVALPTGRISQIVERAGIRVIWTDRERADVAAGLPGVDAVLGPLTADVHGAGHAAWPEPGADSPASLLFTSGSTGAPKGVVYTHRTLLGCALSTRESHGFGPGDRTALVLPQAFAAGQGVLFGALLNGATVCIRDPRVHGLADLVAWLGRTRVTTLHLTPSLLRALVAGLPEDAVLESVRMLTTCGEKLYGTDVAAVRRHLSSSAVVANWLGSSETESIATFGIAATDPLPAGIVPAGRPVPWREVTVRDASGTVLPAGTPGILHVASAYLSTGYWNDTALTDRVYRTLPDGRTLFRTGDRARLDTDGTLHLLGRVDDTVKIRGYLVAPEEVETALRDLPEVADAVVRALPGPDDELRLVAWVVPDPRHRTPTAPLVRSALALVLPAWMVPGDVVVLPSLPRNERGKVAVSELPAPPPRPEPAPPISSVEVAVEAIWAPLLRLDQVGREESFTALGGDSLAVEEMLTTVGTRCGVLLTSADLAEHPSLAEFAALVERGRSDGSPRRSGPMVRLRETGSRPPVFCFAGAGGHAAFFEPLAEALGPDQPVHAFQVNGFENRGLPDWTVGQAARRYVRLIEATAPTGPVLLVGHSLGGLFALRVAQLLGERGREVPMLTLLDTVLPPVSRLAAVPASGPLAALRRSRAGVVGATVVDFLLPTTVRRRRRRPAGTATPATDRAYLRTRLRVLTAGLGTTRDPASRKDVFNLHGIGISRLHRPRPWPGHTLVVSTDENSDDVRWWEPLLPGRREFLHVRCTHTAVLHRPYVAEIAGRLTAVIGEVRENPRD